jgi:hypothetical protein
MPDLMIDIAGRSYSLEEESEGQHYTAYLASDYDRHYTVHCHHGAWTCNCPAQKYKKREEPECKHIFRLRARREEQAREQAGEVFTTPHPRPSLPSKYRGRRRGSSIRSK